jgi:hypothetical protein
LKLLIQSPEFKMLSPFGNPLFLRYQQQQEQQEELQHSLAKWLALKAKLDELKAQANHYIYISLRQQQQDIADARKADSKERAVHSQLAFLTTLACKLYERYEFPLVNQPRIIFIDVSRATGFVDECQARQYFADKAADISVSGQSSTNRYAKRDTVRI